MATFTGLARIDLRTSIDPRWTERCRRSAGLDPETETVARAVIEQVRAGGDAALVELTAQFERREITPASIEVSNHDAVLAMQRVAPEIRSALELAAQRIRRFHRTQVTTSTQLQERGCTLTSRVTPLRRVAVYAPGGTAAYPSSVLMAAIPAKVAGVPEVILLTPRASDVVLAAAEFAGVDRIFEVGGAQAIAAAAYGTQTIPRVDKIVGPGNAYVTAAKRLVFGVCDIDGIAGPSEILIVADRHASPALIAADLLSQAEHDVLACPILVTDDEALIEAVDRELATQLAVLPRKEIATRSLVEQGAAVLVADRSGMVAAANDYAAEHVELLVEGAEKLVSAIIHAGAVFVGPWTPEAAGDYTAGPSHVLPTAGAARFASPLGVWDFVKHTSILHMDEATLREQGEAIITLARAEGLQAHATAVERRLVGPQENDQ